MRLKETWERHEDDRLTSKAYTEVGGVEGAIQKTAERAYAVLKPVQREAARRLFLRLVTPGEGQEDTRARSAIPDDPQQRDVINLFSNPRTRLLVTGYETLQGSTPQTARDLRATVEIAHEALIRRWPILQAWVNTNREGLRARAAILRAKIDWEEKGKIDEYLLDPGIQLERGRSLLGNRLGQRPERVGIGRLADLLQQRSERLLRLRLGQLRWQRPERLGQRHERVRIGRLADLLQQWSNGLLRLSLGQVRRDRLELLRQRSERVGIRR